MDWSQIYLKKEDWQKDTFNRIKQSLISAKDNRFLQFDSSKEEHLVIIYGKSQVGKTTLILNMIGIKDEFFFDVYNTLRAGVPRGNPSTSTAIIYSLSKNDKYGCALSGINNIGAKEVNYYDKKGMIERLQQIRSAVEQNKMSEDKVLFIYIPKEFFVQEKAVDRISILDLPGIEGRNSKEKMHVENLMTKYFSIASVCIIACPSNAVQSLENLPMPNFTNWKDMKHRFLIVITKSYNDGSIRAYFKKKRSERKQSFYDYVTFSYVEVIKKVLGANNKLEVYPVDIGDTFNRLCNEEIIDLADRMEIKETRNKILSELRASIIDRKGECLKTALSDLESVVNRYKEEDLTNFQAEIEKNVRKIQKNTLLIQKVKEYQGEFSHELQKLSNREKVLLENLSLLNAISCDGFSDELFKKLSNYIDENKLCKENSDGKYIRDKEQKIFRELRNYSSSYLTSKIKSVANVIKTEDNEIAVNINESEILANADNECVLIYRIEFYPVKNGIFSKRPKVFFENIKKNCVDIQELLEKYVGLVKQKYADALQKAISICIENIASLNRYVRKQEDKINYLTTEIKNLKETNKELSDCIVEIKNKKSKDQETLDMYLKVAHESYVNQRENIIDMINSKSSAEERLLLIFLLGLMDKDYKKVTGDVNG